MVCGCAGMIRGEAHQQAQDKVIFAMCCQSCAVYELVPLRKEGYCCVLYSYVNIGEIKILM